MEEIHVKVENRLRESYREDFLSVIIGDSGGPLVYQPRRTNQWILIGVTSYGYGCGRYLFPGIYSSVAYFLKWIQTKIEEK